MAGSQRDLYSSPITPRYLCVIELTFAVSLLYAMRRYQLFKYRAPLETITMNKKSKAIKRLNKQVKKLNKRIDKMGKRLEGLQDAPEEPMAEPIAEEALTEAEPEVAAPAAANYTAEEVELAHELTDEAEAVLDILEKEDEIGEKKAASGSKSGKKKKKKLKKKSKK